MTQTYFITFGGPAANWRKRVMYVTAQAKDFGLFDKVYGFTDKDLVNDQHFWTLHGNFLQNNSRGFGYWLWKSYLVKKVLAEMNDGDILLYCDAGCELNIGGKRRMQEYFDIVSKSTSGILRFSMDHPEYVWTKNDLFVHLSSSEEDKQSGQTACCAFIIKKCAHSVNFIDEWHRVCCMYNLIDDSKSITANHLLFREHRHDQSIFSCLAKKYGSEQLPDETYFQNWDTDGAKFPILAKRNK